MATLQAKTIEAKEVWKSPDGKMVLSEIAMDIDGKRAVFKTYSKAIATEGWSGTIETYEKESKKAGVPPETFVKQPQKEQGPDARSPAKFGKEADPFTMYLSYAKDIAGFCVTEKGFNSDMYSDLLEAVSAGGLQLFEARPGATTQPAHEETEEDLSKNIDQSMNQLNAAFGDVENVTPDEPWNPSS